MCIFVLGVCGDLQGVLIRPNIIELVINNIIDFLIQFTALSYQSYCFGIKNTFYSQDKDKISLFCEAIFTEHEKY